MKETKVQSFKKLAKNIYVRGMYYLSLPRTKLLFKIAIILGFMELSSHAFADDPNGDYLEGTDAGATATLKGTGKKLIYLGEGVIAIITYIATKNIKVFLGIIAIAVYLNSLFHMAGA